MRTKSFVRWFSIFTSLAFLLAACQPAPVAAPTGPLQATISATAPVATQMPAASLTPESTQANTEVVATTQATEAAPTQTLYNEVQIFLVALEGSGLTGIPVGCNDQLIAVPVSVDPTDTPLKTALQVLFSAEQLGLPQSTGLYNGLANATLQVVDATIDEQGMAHVQLTGQLLLGGMCDDPRAQNQILETVLHAPGVTDAQITLNGEPFDSFFGGR